MRYDPNDEKQVEHGLIKKNDRGEFYRVARVIPANKNKLESVDMRLMYTTDSGEVRPTQKGVRVHQEALVDFGVAFLKSLEENERNEILESFNSEVGETKDYFEEDDEEYAEEDDNDTPVA